MKLHFENNERLGAKALKVKLNFDILLRERMKVCLREITRSSCAGVSKSVIWCFRTKPVTH